MYNGKKQKEQDFVRPIADQKIIFSEEEFLEEGYCGFDPCNCSEEYLKNVKLFYLTCASESISQITDAYPILEYYSKNTDVSIVLQRKLQ